MIHIIYLIQLARERFICHKSISILKENKCTMHVLVYIHMCAHACTCTCCKWTNQTAGYTSSREEARHWADDESYHNTRCVSYFSFLSLWKLRSLCKAKRLPKKNTNFMYFSVCQHVTCTCTCSYTYNYNNALCNWHRLHSNNHRRVPVYRV